MEIHTSDLGRRVIGCAIEVHRELGPGLLESAYEDCLAEEFGQQGLSFRRQVPVPILYKTVRLECAYRIDSVVATEIALELKAVDRVLPIHHAQVLTYMHLLKIRQAFLMNFNVKLLKDGLKSFLL